MGQSPRPVILCILDGWGHRETAENNAIRLGRTPVFDQLWREAPHALLRTSEGDVGLPEGQMGNSEVGHQNLGAGRVVVQDLPRIDRALDDGSLARNPVLLDFVAALKRSGGACHLMGLLSAGGVHSHERHILGLVKIVAGAGVPVRLHGFLDGRDTAPRAALKSIKRFEQDLESTPEAAIATLVGRYYAMDRDKRWERTAEAYRLLVEAEGEGAESATAAIARAYESDLSDEFVRPSAIGGYAGIRDGDGLLMANFRADRVRQLLTALLDPAFDGFERGRRPEFATACGMVSYSEALDAFLPALFPPEDLTGTLPQAVAEAGMRQLRIAETEKYAHVTFFLNGGSERVFPGEERILVPSPKVATYDLQPEMSAPEVTDRLVEAIRSRRFDLIVVNYANPDMVGHTGDLAAAIRAVETVDRCLGRLVTATEEVGGALLITADHGNVEMMVDPETGETHTAHTTNPVPVVLANAPVGTVLNDGRLADVAPTVLELLALPQPDAMTGRSLIAAAASREGSRASA